MTTGPVNHGCLSDSLWLSHEWWEVLVIPVTLWAPVDSPATLQSCDGDAGLCGRRNWTITLPATEGEEPDCCQPQWKGCTGAFFRGKAAQLSLPMPPEDLLKFFKRFCLFVCVNRPRVSQCCWVMDGSCHSPTSSSGTRRSLREMKDCCFRWDPQVFLFVCSTKDVENNQQVCGG